MTSRRTLPVAIPASNQGSISRVVRTLACGILSSYPHEPNTPEMVMLQGTVTGVAKTSNRGGHPVRVPTMGRAQGIWELVTTDGHVQ